MQIESLNCPNCGAGVMSDSAQCKFCHSRLKTTACEKCLALMFFGSKHCPKCGADTVAAKTNTEENLGDCPRCKAGLSLLQIGEINLRECQRCDGVWSDASTFEDVCADRENNAAVLQWAEAKPHNQHSETKVQYVPCPDCKNLMNRNNFGRSSGVIIDVCKQHGVWFDAEELPRIMEFIHAGGLDRARQKEKMQIDEDRRDLAQKQYLASLDHRISRVSSRGNDKSWDSGFSLSVRDFVHLLFD